jgi:isopenicillin N synthase-like dioxygenase
VVNNPGKKRYAIATFYNPAYGANVDPLDPGLGGVAPLYQPVAAAAHIPGRIDDPMG